MCAHQAHENGDGAKRDEEGEHAGEDHGAGNGLAAFQRIADHQQRGRAIGRNGQQEGKARRLGAVEAQGRGPPSW